MIATPKEIQEENKPKMKRIASLDFQRGLAIWMMVFLHVFDHIWDFSSVGLNDLFTTLNFGLSLVMVIMAFFGGFAGYFILISSVVNSLATTKSAIKRTPPGKLLFKRILTGVGILIAGRITETFGYYGYFGRVLRSGDSILAASTWTDPFALSFFWRRIFMMEALQIIGWCQIITGVVAFFLVRNGGAKKLARNLIIYSGLAVVILVATPFMWNWIDNLNWSNLPSAGLLADWDLNNADLYHNAWPSEALQSENASFLAYLCVILTGDLYPIFPFLATSFIGSAWGLLLAKPKPSKKLPLYGGLVTLGIFVIGAVLNIILGFDLNFQRPPMQYFFLLLGAQFGIMILLLWLVEYRGKAQKFGNNIIVKYFRLWGTIALSVFSLQIWSLVPRAILNPIFNINLMNEKFPLKYGWWVILFAVLTILCYDLLFWLWAQINFIFSFEWFIIKLGSLPTKSVSRRLNVKEILHGVEWMDYKEMSE